MELESLLARCREYEARAARVYRTFAARTRSDAELCAVWTALAREEDEHERLLGRAAGRLDAARGWHTRLDGWDEATQEIEARLAEAERAEIGADVDRQVLAALALERTELDTLSTRLLSLVHAPQPAPGPNEHVGRLLELAARRSTNPTIAFESALLRAQALLDDRAKS